MLVAHPFQTESTSEVEVVVSREGLRVRDLSNDEGNRLLRIVRRSSGSVVTWRRAQMILLSAQGMDVAGIAKVSFNPVRKILTKKPHHPESASTGGRPQGRAGPAEPVAGGPARPEHLAQEHSQDACGL